MLLQISMTKKIVTFNLQFLTQDVAKNGLRHRMW